MNRFEIDKFITYVEASDAEVHSFVADPPGYVSQWISRGAASHAPVPDGGRLSAEAAAALGAIDYPVLYRMGAHPYVLWHFCEAALVWAGELTWPELKEQFRSAVMADGNPDFTT
jgi:hypothetical protein